MCENLVMKYFVFDYCSQGVRELLCCNEKNSSLSKVMTLQSHNLSRFKFNIGQCYLRSFTKTNTTFFCLG